ncbi:MAG: hypothetical protein JXR48_09875 [Candidatus Delongbacteria bacterium]|nr:hypothetical protein [Candidatus Delongbacteria bacterium]MBN2835262.1 hypothetical protein [Candidatus Delongbacteria bacterium]
MKIIVLALVLTFILRAEYGDWKTYTFPGKGNTVSANDDNEIVIGCDGGLFIKKGENVTFLDTDDGLLYPNTVKTLFDSREILWAFHNNGAVTLIDHEGSISYITDLPEHGEYEVYDVHSSENYVYLSTSNGMFRYKFSEEFNRYLLSDNNTVSVNSPIFTYNDQIVIGNENKLLYIDENSLNLDLTFWNKILLGQNINGFYEYNNILYILASNGIYKLTNFEEAPILLQNTSGKNYFSMVHGKNEEFYVSYLNNNKYHILKYDSNFSSFEDISQISDFNGNGIDYADESLFFTTNDKVYAFLTSDIVTSNNYRTLNIGELSLMNFRDEKLYFSNANIISYINTYDFSFSELHTPYSGLIRNILCDSKGNLWAGTWGEGFKKYDPETLEHIETIVFGDDTVSNYYPVCTNIVEAPDGLYFINWGYGTPNLNADGLIAFVPNNSNDVDFYNLGDFDSEFGMKYGHEAFLDSRGYLWVGAANQSFQPTDGADIGILDKASGKIFYTDGVGVVFSIKEDNSGNIWIATDNGVYTCNYNELSDISTMNLSKIRKFEDGLSEKIVYDIAINKLNEKWFATDYGVAVLSPDNETWKFYTPYLSKLPAEFIGNRIESPMLESKVKKILFHDESNSVIFLYNSGISFLEYSGASVSNKIHDFGTNPSPFISDGSKIMQFVLKDPKNYDTAMIYDIRGKLVRGGSGSDRLVLLNGWDGKDNSGKLCSSGIYQVIVFNRDEPGSVLRGKIALVRK